MRGLHARATSATFPVRGNVWLFDNFLHFLSLFLFLSVLSLPPSRPPKYLQNKCTLSLFLTACLRFAPSAECGMGSAARTLSAGTLPGAGHLQAPWRVEGPLLQRPVGTADAQLRPHHGADQLLGGQRPIDPHQDLQWLPLLWAIRRHGRSASQHSAHGLHVSEG